MVIACAVLNIAGVKVVSRLRCGCSSLCRRRLLRSYCWPRSRFGALANAVTKPTTSTVDILGGLLICMWNYMGWDNASTIATEVERPQRTYPRAMLVAVAIVALLMFCRLPPCGSLAFRPSAWETGAWADIAH